MGTRMDRHKNFMQTPCKECGTVPPYLTMQLCDDCMEQDRKNHGTLELSMKVNTDLGETEFQFNDARGILRLYDMRVDCERAKAEGKPEDVFALYVDSDIYRLLLNDGNHERFCGMAVVLADDGKGYEILNTTQAEDDDQ